jgi:hypothetical protein
MNESRQVIESEWTGPVSTGNQSHGHNDGFFASVAEMREYFDDLGIPAPPTVYGCTVRKMDLNAYDIIERAGEDEHCEAVCEEASKEAPALQALLDQWCATLRCASWDEDQSIVVVLGGGA